MYSQVVTSSTLTPSKNDFQSSVIYLFNDNASALWFEKSIKSIASNIDLSVNNDCVVATADTSLLDELLVSVNAFFNSYNNRIITGQQPGWIAHYNSHRNFGCLGIERHESITAELIGAACEDMSSNHLNKATNVAFEKTLDDTLIAKRMSEALAESSHSDKLSPALIEGWLEEANSKITPSSLIPPQYINEKFITPISIANGLGDTTSLSKHAERFVASQQYLRYISTDMLIMYFVDQVERCCMTQESASYTIGFTLASLFVGLKTKQLKQKLIRNFCELCDTGDRKSVV